MVSLYDSSEISSSILSSVNSQNRNQEILHQLRLVMELPLFPRFYDHPNGGCLFGMSEASVHQLSRPTSRWKGIIFLGWNLGWELFICVGFLLWTKIPRKVSEKLFKTKTGVFQDWDASTSLLFFQFKLPSMRGGAQSPRSFNSGHPESPDSGSKFVSESWRS